MLHSFVTSQAELVQEEYSGVQVFQEVEQVFDNPEIDLIIVASPNHTHYDYAEKALMAGKHVIVEKPFTVTVSEAERLIELAESNYLILAPFQNRRWDGDFLTVRKIIEEGTLGEILYFESHFDRFRPQYERVQWKNEQLSGNGILYDLGRI
ncbi:MAG: Gfo/Idh/MocA family oxidoreductase [Prolixibacteraceae bacterium]|nr:Gfo/Idh/MocA family oxidoreductase [Prolixibacteraceae bacterium]